jgi:TPR repeat protein
VKAVKWYRKAAEQNYAAGQAFLAIAYYYGAGVPKDHAEAVKWDRKAAEQNSGPSQYRLGLALSAGDGVAKDPVEGYMWLLLAAKQGDKDAEPKMAELAKELTPDQIAEAQKRANDFKPR